MKKPTPRESAAAEASGCTDEGLLKKFPKIVEYLVTSKWEDGSPREQSALGITLNAQGVNVALNDKDLKQSLYTTAGTLQDALRLMEKALADGVDAWRPWKAGKGKGK